MRKNKLEEFAIECFDDIAKEIGFIRSGALYYRLVDGIFLCFGFESLGQSYHFIVIISPLFTGIGKTDDDRIRYTPRGEFSSSFSPREYYYLDIPEKRIQVKKYYQEMLLNEKNKLKSIYDINTAYAAICASNVPQDLIPVKMALILYRMKQFEKAGKVKNLQYYPDIKRKIIQRDDKSIDEMMMKETERSKKWLKKHGMVCQDVSEGRFS